MGGGNLRPYSFPVSGGGKKTGELNNNPEWNF